MLLQEFLSPCTKIMQRSLLLFRQQSCSLCRQFFFPRATYKSVYNIENVYPNSSADIPRNAKVLTTDSGTFSGYIPIDDVEIKYSKGSGPGGQNVNKVNTKVEVRFHVESANWIPEAAKSQILEQFKTKVNSEGFLIVSSDKTRKQMLNQADCFEKIRSMVFLASQPPREPTEEDLKIISAKQERARQRMLREKKERSLKKASRQKPNKYSLL